MTGVGVVVAAVILRSAISELADVIREHGKEKK